MEERLAVADVLRHYLNTLRCRRPESVFTQTKPLFRLLGDLTAEALKGHHLAVYRATRTRGEPDYRPVTDSTVNHELTYLRAAFRRALDDELVAHMPKVTLTPAPPPRQKYVTRDQLYRLLEHLEDDQRDIVEFTFHTGWRRDAVLGLTWDQVNSDAGMIVLTGEQRGTKGVSAMFPIEGTVRAILERRRAKRNSLPWVFLRNGKRVKGIRRCWKTATRKAGLPGLRLHDLRRSFAHWHLEQGVQREVTMKLAGWKTDSMYRRYAIVDLKNLREAVRRSEARRGDDGLTD